MLERDSNGIHRLIRLIAPTKQSTTSSTKRKERLKMTSVYKLLLYAESQCTSRTMQGSPCPMLITDRVQGLTFPRHPTTPEVYCSLFRCPGSIRSIFYVTLEGQGRLYSFNGPPETLLSFLEITLTWKADVCPKQSNGIHLGNRHRGSIKTTQRKPGIPQRPHKHARLVHPLVRRS